MDGNLLMQWKFSQEYSRKVKKRVAGILARNFSRLLISKSLSKGRKFCGTAIWVSFLVFKLRYSAKTQIVKKIYFPHLSFPNWQFSRGFWYDAFTVTLTKILDHSCEKTSFRKKSELSKNSVKNMEKFFELM